MLRLTRPNLRHRLSLLMLTFRIRIRRRLRLRLGSHPRSHAMISFAIERHLARQRPHVPMPHNDEQPRVQS